VGIGWERQLADQWSMRAEYRYTHFLDKTLSTPSSSASSDGMGNTNVSSSTSQSTISADSHIVRFGVARAFGG
jgi:opacity protein-like surface antigen